MDKEGMKMTGSTDFGRQLGEYMRAEVDLKKYLKISKINVEKSLSEPRGLQLINSGKEDADYWIDYFTFNDELTSLENFCRYRAAGAFGLYEKGYDDGDITAPVIEHFKRELLNIDEVESVKVGREISEDEKDRTFHVTLKNNDVLYFETDTAISLMGDFGRFMRKIIHKVEGLSYKSCWPEETYMKYYNLPKDWRDEYYAPFKMYYFGEIQSKIKNRLTSEREIECYESFEERAKNVHTIKNMMLVPYGYNSPRGFSLRTYKSNIKINDRLDLTLRDFEEMISETAISDICFQKRLGLKRNAEFVTSDAVRFLLKYKKKLMPSIPEFDSECEKDTIEGSLKKNRVINRCYIV